MSGRFHQFHAVVELAVVEVDEDREPPVVLPRRGSPLADRARAATARVGRGQLEVRDALWACLEAIGGLERTIAWLIGSRVLSDAGIELKPELVLIGEEAIDLQRSGPWAEGQPVVVYVVLELRDARHMLTLHATVQAGQAGARLQLQDLRGDQRDQIVAFVFQQEAKERRRALDAPC